MWELAGERSPSGHEDEFLRALLVGHRRRTASAGAIDGQHAVGERPGLRLLTVVRLGGDDELAAIPLRGGGRLTLTHGDRARRSVELVGLGCRRPAVAAL